MCTLTVVLTPTVAKFFTIHNSSPHVSLAKANDVQWENLTQWVARCSQDCTWEDRGEGIQYSPQMQTYRCPFQSTFKGKRTVHLAQTTKFKQKGWGNFSQLTIDSPELQEVPEKLWAKDKYDLGLVKGTEPLNVTPKSTYCFVKHNIHSKQRH